MEKHVRTLSLLYIILGFFHIFAAVIVFVIIAGAGLLSGDIDAITITSIVATVIASILVITAVPGIVGGFVLYRRKEWARIFVLVLGFLNLPAIPFGTALGTYTIWVLVNDEVVKMYSNNAVPAH